jgi:hypothetical protein
MADFKLLSARQNLANAEKLGQTERAKRAKARVAELEAGSVALDAGPSMSNTKDELLAAAGLAGVTVDESMTKAEILEALES